MEVPLNRVADLSLFLILIGIMGALPASGDTSFETDRGYREPAVLGPAILEENFYQEINAENENYPQDPQANSVSDSMISEEVAASLTFNR